MKPLVHGSRSRASFIGGVVAAGAGIAITQGADPGARADNVIPGDCSDSVQAIVDTALAAEQVAIAFYYTGLTTPVVSHDRRLTGLEGNSKYLRAALDAERNHAALLIAGGAHSVRNQFYFPATTFRSPGDPLHPGTFFEMLEQLETAFVNAYGVAVSQLLELGRPDLAELVARVMGVEAEHRTLGRVITRTLPANDLTLERVPYACVTEVGRTLQPFLTGKGFGGATVRVGSPTPAQIDRVVGRYRTRIVKHFL